MTSSGWDFEVQRIDLDQLDVDAGQGLGMVIVQPEYQLDPDGAVPFRISEACREAQIGLIERAFQIREAEREERGAPIPFVLFPEAAIPVIGPDGLTYLHEQMEEAQGEVIFIGGLEGLSRQEAEQVADQFGAERPVFTAGAFVNLCVIVIKSANGCLSWHFQAKIRPSQWEQPRNMACGKRVLYFVAPRVAFLCQICFDHIAQDGEEALNDALCRQIVEKTEPHVAKLDFVFVPQYNEQPNHESFRRNTSYLVNRQRGLSTQGTQGSRTVVVVNRAAALQEPSKYGQSGFHYAADRWPPPTNDIGPKGYELYDLDDVTSAVFRKRTPAIHVATLVPPSHNVGNSGNPRYPLDIPRSYLIGNGCDATGCSCLPGTSCAAGTHVECDCLPCKLRDCLLQELPKIDPANHRWTGSKDDISSAIKSYYSEIREALLALNCQRAVELLDLLFFAHKNRNRNPETWEELNELDGVRELSAALSILREHGQIDFETASRWTARLGNAISIAVLDGGDSSDCQALAERYLKQHDDYAPEARSAPVLIVALRSTGRVEPIVAEFQPEYTKARDRGPSSPPSPYEPARVRAFLCRDDLFQKARQATALGDYLSSKMEGIHG